MSRGPRRGVETPRAFTRAVAAAVTAAARRHAPRGAGRGGARGTVRDSGRDSAALWLAPSLTGFTVFFILPFAAALVYAFLDRPTRPTFVGFANFAGLFTNRAYLRGLFNTARFLALIVPLNIALSLAAAMLLLLVPVREGRRWWTLVFLAPLVIPSGSMVFFWKCFFDPAGILNGFLERAAPGAALNWLDSSLAFPVMALIFIWKNMGYTMVLYMSALSSIPRDYYEAAAIDGAGAAARFTRVTLPCLAPATVLTLTMSVINSFKIFREIYLITGTYPHESVYTLQHFMNNMFVSLNYPKLTAAAALMTLCVTLLTLALLRWQARVEA